MNDKEYYDNLFKETNDWLEQYKIYMGINPSKRINVFGDNIILITSYPTTYGYVENKEVFKLITLPEIIPHRYFISSKGIVLSVGNNRNPTDIYVMQYKYSKDGSYRIALTRNPDLPNQNKDQTDKHFYTSIHYLVKRTWDPDDKSYETLLSPVIRHKDGNLRNNDINNLEWIERHDSNMFGKGTDFVQNRMTSKEEIKSIAKIILDNPDATMRELTELTGYGHDIVSNIKFGKSWSRISGISSGDFEREKHVMFTEDQVNEIIDMILAGYTDTEISDLMNIPSWKIGSIRHKDHFIDLSRDLEFISSQQASYKDEVIGEKGDIIVKINDIEYKDIYLPNVVIPHTYYINRDGEIKIVDWDLKRAKSMHLDEHVNGKKTYNQYLLRRTVENFKDRFVVCKEDLVLYFWNPPTNYRPKIFDMLETGKRFDDKVDEYSGEMIKRPSPMTREKAEEIARYMIDNPNKTNSDISKEFGFSATSIGHLRSGDTFKDICEKYNLASTVNKRSTALSDEQVLEIADYIIANSNASNIDIAEKFGIHRDTVSHIKRKSQFQHLLKDYNFNSKPRENMSHLERCYICKLHFVDMMSVVDIAKLVNKDHHVVRNFLKSKFAEWWKQTYYINTTIPRFQYDYFVPILINTMNNGKGVTPFDVDMKQKYAPVTGKGLTPFDIK